MLFAWSTTMRINWPHFQTCPIPPGFAFSRLRGPSAVLEVPKSGFDSPLLRPVSAAGQRGKEKQNFGEKWSTRSGILLLYEDPGQMRVDLSGSPGREETHICDRMMIQEIGWKYESGWFGLKHGYPFSMGLILRRILDTSTIPPLTTRSLTTRPRQLVHWVSFRPNLIMLSGAVFSMP